MPCEIGERATVAHLCVVHGGALSGGCRRRIPAEVLAAGSPAVVKKPIQGTPAEFWVQMNPPAYADLARRHAEGVEGVG